MQFGVWGQSLGEVSEGKARKSFDFLMPLRRLTAFNGIEKLYSWSKKLYQFMANLFSMANIPTYGCIIPHREEFHTQLPLELVQQPYGEISVLALLH